MISGFKNRSFEKPRNIDDKHDHQSFRMNILFVHNNFPAQFRHIAAALAQDDNNTVVAIGSIHSRSVKGVKLHKYALSRVDLSHTHPFARRFDIESHRAEQVLYSLSAILAGGFVPDVIVAHPGWGETLPLRSIFPKARIVLYCEFFYGTEGRDVGFDPEFPQMGADGNVSVNLKNAATLLALADCDVGVSPTEWQRSTFPLEYQKKIKVIHEGVDTTHVAPNPDAVFRLDARRSLSADNDVITFVARNIEPLRGYHVFMRALPRIMRELPHVEIVVIGSEHSYYGSSPPAGSTWQSIFLHEVEAQIDPKRIHFTGRLPHDAYLSALQVSSAHVYLTYPFVLSWSFIESLSVGCMVVGSDTAPVREVIDGQNGILVPFFDSEQIAENIVDAVQHPRKFDNMRAAARQTAVERFDLEKVCLPSMIDAIRGE
jgi:glycosyltransferase involved in cell wall biosynthesis